MVAHVRGLAALKLRVQRQRNQPRLWRVAERANRGARVGKEKPRALLVMSEHLSDAVGIAREKLGREPRLECLHRRARLEPSDAVGERHAEYGRPGPLVLGFDRAYRRDMGADPVFGSGDFHGYHYAARLRSRVSSSSTSNCRVRPKADTGGFLEDEDVESK